MVHTVTDNFGRELWLRIVTKVGDTWFVDVLTDSTILAQFSIEMSNDKFEFHWIGKGFTCCNFNFVQLSENDLRSLFLELVLEGGIPR